MSQEMKILTILIAMGLICTLTDGKVLRYPRGTNSLKGSYIVHFNSKGEPLNVAGFDEFVRALNGQRGNPAMESSASYVESPVFPVAQATPVTTVSKLMTTTERTSSHQTGPLASGSSGTQGSMVTAKASPEPAHVVTGSTASPLKLPHEMSGTSPTIAETSVSTDKPTLTLALGHDVAAKSAHPADGPTLSDVSNLVTPGANTPSKMTVSSLGLSHGTGLTSKVISLQPGVQTVLNYAQPPVAQTSYLQALPATFQKHYTHDSPQPEIFNYASYPNQNLVIDGNTPSQIVRQAPPLIDIGQGLGQGYRSAPQELPLNLGGWGGVEYHSGHRSIRLAKPVRRYSKFGHRYSVPVSSRRLRKIGFGPGSW